MSIRQGKKITELTELNSASLSTYVVGVDNDVTYKVSLNVLENTIVDIFSSSVDTRLDTLESQNASTDNRLNNLESSVNLENDRLDSIESETGSYLKPENSIEFYIPLFSSGNILLNSNVKVSGSSVLIGSDISNHPEVPEKLAVYAGNTDSYNLISGHGTINNYLQLNIKNFGEYGNSSSDVVATANNGNEEEFYVNMGINGSAYDEDTIVGGANDAYIYGTGNKFHVGNASEHPVIIFAGGFDSKGENLKLVIDPFDNHIMTGSLEINGNLTTLGDVTASNIYSVNQTISGSVFIYDAYGEFEYPIILQTDRNGSFSISNGPIEAADGLIIAGEKYLKIINDANSNYDTYIENINNVGLRISASTATDAMLELSGYSLNLQNTFTASVSEGYIWVGNSTNKTYEIPTASFARTGSNTFVGNQIISGSLEALTGLISSTIIPIDNFALSLYGVNDKIVLWPGSNVIGNRSKEIVEIKGDLHLTGSLNGLGNIKATSITASIAATNGVISSSAQISESGFVSSSTINNIETITSASYAAITPVSGTLYIIID